MKLTQEHVNEIVSDRKSQFLSWNKSSIKDFISVWEVRRRMAVAYHNDKRLEALAKDILNFVNSRDPIYLRMYVGRPKGKSFAFLYDDKTKEYLQMIEHE